MSLVCTIIDATYQGWMAVGGIFTAESSIHLVFGDLTITDASCNDKN